MKNHGVTRTKQWRIDYASFGDELSADLFIELIGNEVSSVSSDEKLTELADVSVRAAAALVARLLLEKDKENQS